MSEAVEAVPAFVEPRLAIARWLLLGNKAGEAFDKLKEVLRLEPDNAEAHLGIGRAHMLLGQHQRAFEAMFRAIELDPADPDAYFYRGMLFEQGGHFHLAALDYSRALARQGRDRKSPDVFQTGDPAIHLVRVLMRGGQPRLAVDMITDILKELQDSEERSLLLVQRADANEQLGDLHAAAEDIAAAARSVAPDKRAGLYLRRSVLLQRSGRVDSARQEIQRALEIADLRTVLRVQVFLRNQGMLDVEITGEFDKPTREAVQSCFATVDCGSALSRSI